MAILDSGAITFDFLKCKLLNITLLDICKNHTNNSNDANVIIYRIAPLLNSFIRNELKELNYIIRRNSLEVVFPRDKCFYQSGKDSFISEYIHIYIYTQF